LEQLALLSDSHPFNIEFITESVRQYTLPVVLADSSELVHWKRRRSTEFLQKVKLTSNDIRIMSALREFRALDFSTIPHLLADDASAVSVALMKLMDFHIVEAAGDAYCLSPPLMSAVSRDARLDLSQAEHRLMLRAISDTLRTTSDGEETSISMIEAGILATLQEGESLPPLFSAFLLPSHQIWLGRRAYDRENYGEALSLTKLALNSDGRLSKAGVIEGSRLLCLSASRLNKNSDFDQGISTLSRLSSVPRAKSSVHFLRGFNARLKGFLPEAEKELRLSVEYSPGNFSAVRELAYVCRVRGDLDAAEGFARKAYEIAPDNAYIIDTLLTVLLNQNSTRHNKDWPAAGFEDTEIMVFDRSGGVGWRDVGIRVSTS
jgi:tetratricopeptide (TPR) repeat protein